MEQQRIEVATPEGSMTTFVHRPSHGGPHPVVLYLMDAPSIRPELHDMASRLASAGYYVLLPFLFYRGSEFREFGADDADMHQRFELMGTVTPTNIVSDAEALLARIPRLPEPVVERIVLRFGNLQKIMRATIDDLDDVGGVGETRARSIKDGLARLAESSILDRYS